MNDASKLTHIPVMDREVIDALLIKPNGVYVDTTFGRGGHSRLILERLNENGRLIIFDRDLEAIKNAKRDYSRDDRVSIVHDSFAHYADGLHKSGYSTVDGVLFDLGLSSPQIDDADRGFSFNQQGPLDMRMNHAQGISASEWLKRASKEEITYVLDAYGQEPHASVIADAICKKRDHMALETTADLVDIVVSTVPTMKRNHHPATLVFQAIRIYINDEQEQISSGVAQALSSLNNQGRMVVLSYHSLETKWVSSSVKQYMQSLKGDMAYRPFRIKKVGKGRGSTIEEQAKNRRSRSALMKVWEKVYGKRGD